MAKVMARLTMFQEPKEVDEDELPNLRSQRLLIEESEPAPDDGPGGSGEDGAGEDGTPVDPGSDGQQPKTRTARGSRSGDSNGEPA